jgi:PAS domain S-box-containing protein
MMAGSAIAVGLVAASWEDRLQSQLAQVARNTTDALVRRERNQLDFLLLIASAPATLDRPSVAAAFASGNTEQVKTVLQPYYELGLTNVSLDIDRIVAFDRSGKTYVDWLRVNDEASKPPEEITGTDLSQLEVVKRITGSVTVNGNDKFSNLIYFAPDPQPYFYTVAPIRQNDQVVGGVMVAIKIDRLLTALERDSQSVVTTFYDLNGTPIGSTLVPRPDYPSLQMSAQALQPLLNGAAQSIYTVGLNNRNYRLFYSPLLIQDGQIGYFSVGLSTDFQVRTLNLSRDIVLGIAIALALGTVALGYLIARQITQPLVALVDTAEAVTAGDLDARTPVVSNDEFGKLAQAFNQMTSHLSRLYSTSRELSTSIAVDHVLTTATGAVRALVPGSDVVALLEDQGALRYQVSAAVATHAGALASIVVPAAAVLERAFGAQREPLYTDPMLDERLSETGLGAAAGYQSAIIAPLVVRNQLSGALIIAHQQPHAFDGASGQTVTSVASMAASVLNNAVLFDRVQDEASRRQAILESIADGVIVCDMQRNIILLNPAAERMLRSHDDEAIPTNLNDIALERADVSSDLFMSDAGDIEHYSLNNRIMRLSKAPVKDEHGVPVGEVVVMHDISDEVALDLAKTNFIATISHELRSPLTVILGYTDLLLRGLVGELSAEQRELLEAVRNRVDLMTKIITNVITVASIEANNLNTQIEPQELWVAVEQALNSTRGALAKKGLEVTIDVPNDLPPVLADREQLQLILAQLLDNARRYTQSGSITIHAERHDDFVHITISDTGPGISDEQQSLLFTRFHRVDGNSSPERGSGLGLVITRQLVERQGGRVWATSQVGIGSTFGFSLPIAHADINILADQQNIRTTSG